MSAESAQLLLRPDTTVTCPKCADKFSLDRGFAKKALEQLAETSAHAIAAVRDAERAHVEKRAQQLALERARGARGSRRHSVELLAFRVHLANARFAKVFNGLTNPPSRTKSDATSKAL